MNYQTEILCLKVSLDLGALSQKRFVTIRDHTGRVAREGVEGRVTNRKEALTHFAFCSSLILKILMLQTCCLHIRDT